MRATVSELLPGVNGTMKRIGRSGQRASLVCACAALAQSNAASIVDAKRVMAGYPASLVPNVCGRLLRSRNLLGLAQAFNQG